MADILDILNIIQHAQYGRDVRQAIVDGISQCYEDGKAGVNDLKARQLIESAIAVNEDQQAELMNLLARIEELEGGVSGEGTTESTTIEVPSFIIDSGIVENITIESRGTNSRTITFSKEFTEIPIVSCVVMVQQAATANYANVQVIVVKSSISTTGFKFTVANMSGAQRSTTIGWFAIQPTTKTIPIDVTIPDADGMSEAEVREITNPIQTSLDGIKTGYDGTVYDTHGEAVREQINDLHVLIGDTPGTAIQASAVAYNGSNVAAELTTVNGRLEQIEQGGSGLAEDGKQALLAIARSVVYSTPNGQELYNALYNAFYPPANLVGITAVYTQSGTVTTTSSLDSLKKDLVVNAVYSDGTIAEINDYTLSGTLVSGTSTITVTYSSKTANFTVNVIEALYMLPESTVFDGTNYIDTGVKLASVDRSYTIMITETNGQNVVSYPLFHCMTESSPYPGLAFQKLSASGYAVAGYSRRNVPTTINPEINNTNKVVFRHEAGSQYLYVDYATNGVRGEQLIVDNGGTFAQSDNNLLIGCYQTTNGDKGRFWRGIISDFVILSNVIDDNAVTEYLGV